MIAASKRITEIVAQIARITRFETMPGSQFSPMLDVRVSGASPDGT